MSNEMAPECINHKENRNLQVRLDYMFLYRSESKAKIIRVIESWTNTKYAEWYKSLADSHDQGSTPSEEDLWVTMSYDQFSLFVYGTIKHDTVKKQIDELVEIGHIQRRPHPTIPYGPPQYLLNRGMLQGALDDLDIPPNLFDLFPSFVPPQKKHTPPEQYPGGGGNAPGGDPRTIPPGTGEQYPPSNNTTKNTENQSKGDTSGASAHRSAPTPKTPASQQRPVQQNLTLVRRVSAVTQKGPSAQASALTLPGFAASPAPVEPTVLSAAEIKKRTAVRCLEIMELVDKTVEDTLPRSPKKWVQEALTDMISAGRSNQDIIISTKDLVERGGELTYQAINKNIVGALRRSRTNQAVTSTPTPGKRGTVSGLKRLG